MKDPKRVYDEIQCYGCISLMGTKDFDLIIDKHDGGRVYFRQHINVMRLPYGHFVKVVRELSRRFDGIIQTIGIQPVWTFSASTELFSEAQILFSETFEAYAGYGLEKYYLEGPKIIEATHENIWEILDNGDIPDCNLPY